MPLTLREVLDLDVLREAKPEVLVGGGSLDRVVRWVHSSEIYEIGPLLSGGELLLTTGLGLAGPDAGARRHYVRDLADRGVTALALELGRTFDAVPGELVEEARRFGLPLIVLTEVVPFIRISQVANTAIVDGETARLRLGDAVSRALNEALVTGSGVGGLLAAAVAVTGSPLVVLSGAGALVAGSGVGDHRDAWSVVDVSRHVVPVRVHGQLWGRLVAGPGSALADGELFDVLERTSAALSLAVLLTGTPPSRPDRQISELLADLADSTGTAVPGEAAYRLRAGVAGFQPRPDQQIVPVAVDGPESGPALAMVERSARRLGTQRIAGRVVQDVLALLVVGADVRDAVGAAQSAIEEARSRIAAPELTVALGPAAPGDAGPSTLAAGLRTAQAALRLTLAERARGGAPVATSRTLALELELLAGGDPARLERLATSVIGPLVDWDAAHRSELVRTLEVLLRHGGSPTRAAAALHLGRQSLYQRIERIESLLGVRVDDPALHASLLLATCAHRLSSR